MPRPSRNQTSKGLHSPNTAGKLRVKEYARLIVEEHGADKEEKLAIARTAIGITMREGGSLKVERSVYGAAIVMPQLARTSGWSKSFTILAIRAQFFLILNVFLQAFVLKMLAKEDSVMDKFGGQMYLCDFGADMINCPGPGCRGPGGTDIIAPRLYSWEAIVNRNFVVASLKQLFPDKIDEIDEKVDVGEYGIESYWCRVAACFIYIIACLDELIVIFKIFQLICKIPSKPEPWIQAKPKVEGRPPTGAIEDVSIVIAGMPLKWKMVTMIMVAFPKLMLWRLAVLTGVTFLMETAGIDDIIVNSVGLSFILNIDEIIFSSLMSEETQNFVSATAEVPLFDSESSCVGDMSLLSEDEILTNQKDNDGLWSWNCWDTLALLPVKLLISIFLTFVCVMEYYYTNCEKYNHDGVQRWVSKPMYTPLSVAFDWLNAFLPHIRPLATADTPYWQMPPEE